MGIALPGLLLLLSLFELGSAGSTCGANTWRPSWASSPDAACALWAGSTSWGALKNGQTLEEGCRTSTFAQQGCSLTCCDYQLPPSMPPSPSPPPPSYPPAVPDGHPYTPPPPPRPPPSPPSPPGPPSPPPEDIIIVLEEDLEAAEHEVLDELGMSGHHAFHFGLGLACLLVLIFLTATCFYCIRKRFCGTTSKIEPVSEDSLLTRSTPMNIEELDELPAALPPKQSYRSYAWSSAKWALGYVEEANPSVDKVEETTATADKAEATTATTDKVEETPNANKVML